MTLTESTKLVNVDILSDDGVWDLSMVPEDELDAFIKHMEDQGYKVCK